LTAREEFRTEPTTDPISLKRRGHGFGGETGGLSFDNEIRSKRTPFEMGQRLSSDQYFMALPHADLAR